MRPPAAGSLHRGERRLSIAFGSWEQFTPGGRRRLALGPAACVATVLGMAPPSALANWPRDSRTFVSAHIGADLVLPRAMRLTTNRQGSPSDLDCSPPTASPSRLGRRTTRARAERFNLEKSEAIESACSSRQVGDHGMVALSSTRSTDAAHGEPSRRTLHPPRLLCRHEQRGARRDRSDASTLTTQRLHRP